MLLRTHLTDGTTESQGKLSHLPPVPELENRESGLKPGLGPSPHNSPHPHPHSMPHPASPAKQVACQVEQLFPKQTLHKPSCPGLFLTFNAWLLPLTRLHVPSPGSTPARFPSPISQRLSGAFRRGEVSLFLPSDHSQPETLV